MPLSKLLKSLNIAAHIMIRIDIIERKINTAKDLHSIVKTMKGLAALSINQYDNAVKSVTEYFSAIEKGLQIVLRGQPQLATFFQPRQSQSEPNEITIVFGAGQPMCGSFNEVIANYFDQQLGDDFNAQNDKIVALGHRVTANLGHYGRSADHVFEMPTTIEHINTTVQQLVLAILQWNSSEGYSRTYLCYNRPKANSGFTPTVEQLLPIDMQWLQQLTQGDWESRSLPIYSMEATELISALTKELLFVSIYKALAASLSAENNSRLAAMQVAEKKIEEMIEDLTKAYRNQRQANITEEILDIMTSFEVLGEGNV